MAKSKKKHASGGDSSRRKKKHAGGSSRGGGSMMSMRSGFKGLVRGKKSKGPTSTARKVWDVAFWVLLAAAAGFFVYRRFFTP